MTGVCKKAVLKLLVDLGTACARYQDEHLRKLSCTRIQWDEIWSFCYAKEKNVPEEFKGKLGFGDTWTWVAIDADTKLIASYLVGGRSAEYAKKFIDDLASRLTHRIQLTTDGHKSYRKRLKAHSERTWTTPCWKRFMRLLHAMAKSATALRTVAEHGRSKSRAIPT